MTVEINQEKLLCNCHTLRKIFNIEVPISGKILRHPPPPVQLQMFRYVPESALRIAVQLWVFILPPSLIRIQPCELCM